MLKRQISKKIAAIDIGSNAIRMVVAEVYKSQYRLLKKYRFAIRLGADVFEQGKIKGKNLKSAARTFKRFSELARKNNIYAIRAVGTSALREASNREAFVELIRRKSQIDIEIIDGVEEARLIYLAIQKAVPIEQSNCLLIDIGGGSVELTFSENGMMTATQSFPFGTVRTLQALKKKNQSEKELPQLILKYLESLLHFIQSHQTEKPLGFAVGTGGNLEALGKLKEVLLKHQDRSLLSLEDLDEIVFKLQKMTMKERTDKLGLRADRADVILPAAMIVQSVLHSTGLKKIVIPHVGLKDGLLWSMSKEL